MEYNCIFKIIGLVNNLCVLNPRLTTINNMPANFLYDFYFLSELDSKISIKKSKVKKQAIIVVLERLNGKYAAQRKERETHATYFRTKTPKLEISKRKDGDPRFWSPARYS